MVTHSVLYYCTTHSVLLYYVLYCLLHTGMCRTAAEALDFYGIGLGFRLVSGLGGSWVTRTRTTDTFCTTEDMCRTAAEALDVYGVGLGFWLV
jgi:hypothetical protein